MYASFRAISNLAARYLFLPSNLYIALDLKYSQLHTIPYTFYIYLKKSKKIVFQRLNSANLLSNEVLVFEIFYVPLRYNPISLTLFCPCCTLKSMLNNTGLYYLCYKKFYYAPRFWHNCSTGMFENLSTQEKVAIKKLKCKILAQSCKAAR